MAAYTQEHFTFEEERMTTCGYADAPRHKAEHLSFIEYVERTLKRLEMEDFVSSVELITYLKDWLKNHIMNVDKLYGACLASCDEAACRTIKGNHGNQIRDDSSDPRSFRPRLPPSPSP